MEDKNTAKISDQLRIFAELQNRIEETRKQLGNLTRIEVKEKGLLRCTFNKSLAASRNKLNLWENHVRSNQQAE